VNGNLVPRGGQRRQYFRPRFLDLEHSSPTWTRNETEQALGCGGIFLPSSFPQDTASLRSTGVRIHKHRYNLQAPVSLSILHPPTRRRAVNLPVLTNTDQQLAFAKPHLPSFTSKWRLPHLENTLPWQQPRRSQRLSPNPTSPLAPQPSLHTVSNSIAAARAPSSPHLPK
jgi:hypothetical protein